VSRQGYEGLGMKIYPEPESEKSRWNSPRQ